MGRRLSRGRFLDHDSGGNFAGAYRPGLSAAILRQVEWRQPVSKLGKAITGIVDSVWLGNYTRSGCAVSDVPLNSHARCHKRHAIMNENSACVSYRVLRGKDKGSGEVEETPRSRCFAAAAGSA